jgi:hypothetical protein
MIGHRPAPRIPAKHTRNVQSMSSLPSTPLPRNSRGGDRDHRGAGLLPSIDLVPQTEPPRQRHYHHYHHNAARFMPETPTTPRGSGSGARERRKSRESTISAEDNQELARQALQSFASRGSQQSSRGVLRGGEAPARDDLDEGEGDEEVFESQASQAASEMLRRDSTRGSFEAAAASAVRADLSRDGTPVVTTAADRSAKLQAKLFGGLNKSGLSGSGVGSGSGSVQGKRKFSGQHHGEVSAGGDGFVTAQERVMTSPTKKLREVGGLRDPGRVGLGIQYGRGL